MTLVSYDHDFIYLRTRKTASTSTEMYLQPFCMPPGRALEEYSPRPIVSRHGIVGRRLTHREPSRLFKLELAIRRRLGLTNWAPHMPAATVKNGLAPGFWNKALKITSVRNPFARLISSFYFFHDDKVKAAATQGEVIAAFRGLLRRRRFWNDSEIVFIGESFVPDVLIRQEHIAGDLDALAKRLGLDTSRTALPVTKKTASSDAAQRPPLSAFYDTETADIVRDQFDWVFTHAGYSREVPE